MPFAQSSELPPPRPTIESMRSRAAWRHLEHICIGVRAEIVEIHRLNTGRRQRCACVIVVAGHQPRIGDEQRAAEPELSGQRTELIDRSIAEQHTNICFEIQLWTHPYL